MTDSSLPQNQKMSVAESDDKKELTYSNELEGIIAAEGEKASALFWLHNQAEAKFARLNTIIQLPVIVLSTVSGTASIGSQTLFGGGPGASIGIGVLSLTVATLGTVSSYFGWARRAEGHKMAAIQYSKLQRLIMIELALPREQRVSAKHLVKDIRQQIDRLNETSPAIPTDILAAFHAKFGDIENTVAIPEVCNGIHKIEAFKTVIRTPHFAESPKPVMRDGQTQKEDFKIQII